MSLNKTIQFMTAFGVFSLALMLYFYIKQKDFTKYHKEFINTSTVLQLEQNNLSNNILHSSLKTYFNQDIIVQNIKNLHKTFQKLQNIKLLQNKNYKSVALNLSIIKEQLNIEFQDIQRYTMLNAGIKNSFLFLNRHLKNNTFKEIQNQAVYFEAIRILKLLQDTKNTLDMDNIYEEKLQLTTTTHNQKMQKFISSFNLHSLYLQKQLPLFIAITNKIAKNDISIKISELNTFFSAITLHDFKAFDKYAFIVLILLCISFTFIFVFFSKYASEQKKLIKIKQHLENALIHDELTGIKNRKSFEIEIQKHDAPFLLLINIVRFKNINDVYGTNDGNKILKQFALFLTEQLKSSSRAELFRLGSDEFCIICTQKTKKEVIAYAHHLDTLICNHAFKINTTQIYLQVKIAINNIKPYLENADLTLKLLKKDYSKSILLHQEGFGLKKNISDALKMIEQIKTAIAQDRVIPYFQPIINIQNMKIEKYEALIRIRCLDGKMLLPYQFLELSKKSSYYNKLTKLMIKKTLQTAKEFPEYRFSINISMLDISNDGFLQHIFEEFDKNLEASSRIDIELLESEEMLDKEKIVHFINRAKTYGSKILIDDFGTGYSNFSNFSYFEINYIKIDGSITKEIATNSKKLHIFKSICDFSKGMEIENIAEFVENKEILDILKEIGVKYAQGYYFSKPLPRPLKSNKIKLS